MGDRERKLNRLSKYDYSSPGFYFITINVYNREPVFGEIVNNNIILSQYGKIAKQCWDELPDHTGYCELDEYIIMPDHVHGIIIIPAVTVGDRRSSVGNRRSSVGNRCLPVGNRHACSLRGVLPQHMKLPVIIGSYKSAVSKLIHRSGRKEFRWQKSFHDRIIRDQNELDAIRKYIRQNPGRWWQKNMNYSPP